MEQVLSTPSLEQLQSWRTNALTALEALNRGAKRVECQYGDQKIRYQEAGSVQKLLLMRNFSISHGNATAR